MCYWSGDHHNGLHRFLNKTLNPTFGSLTSLHQLPSDHNVGPINSLANKSASNFKTKNCDSLVLSQVAHIE